MPTAHDAKLLRDLSGFGITDCVKALNLAEDDPAFGGDVVLALCYVDAGGLAINVRGDRHAWNMERARSMVEETRERNPDLDAAFPSPGVATPAP